MTRNARAIVALFLGLVAMQLSPVSAASTCTGFAREQCERLQATTGSTASFSIQAPASVHWYTPGGIAQEHFEAMSVLAPESYRMDPAAVQPHTTSVQERFLEVNTDWLPISGQNEEQSVYRVSDSYHYVPVAGRM